MSETGVAQEALAWKLVGFLTWAHVQSRGAYLTAGPAGPDRLRQKPGFLYEPCRWFRRTQGSKS